MLSYRGGACAVIILLSLTLGACRSVGGGGYVGRNEFDNLSQRVSRLETTVQNMGGNLPLLASGGSPSSDGSPVPAGGLLPPTDGGALLPPAGQAPLQTAQAPASGSEKTLYQKGQSLLKQKKYDQAAAVFSQMLNQNPGGRLAPNARYWLGECRYAQGRFREAAAEFQRCAADYPQSAKAPDALLKLSYCYDRLGDGPQAMAALDRLLTNYPKSDAAGLMKSGRGRFSG